MTGLSRYLAALATVVRGSAIPYGYTITIWTSGVVLEHGHPKPDVGQAWPIDMWLIRKAGKEKM